MKHVPPYVRRWTVYSIRDYECGHYAAEGDAYREVARCMWNDAEDEGSGSTCSSWRRASAVPAGSTPCVCNAT